MVDYTSNMPLSNADASGNIDSIQVDTFTAFYFGNALALMKLRQKGASKVSQLTKGVFGHILEYCQPVMTETITDHYKYNKYCQINFTWPKEPSYQNPVTGIMEYYDKWWFKLQSGEKTSNASDKLFKDLNQSDINSIVIRYTSNDSRVTGFEFYNSENQLILKIGWDRDASFRFSLRKGERVVGIQAHRDIEEYCENFYYNLQFIIMGL